MTSARPHEPEVAAADLPATRGHIGADPEDFSVDEVPLYEASGSGDHWYVRLRKRNLTTQDLIRLVSRASGVDSRDIGSAGLKDKHAVTTQWLSVPVGKAPPEEWKLEFDEPASVELVETSRHKNKLRTGHLKANHFRIRLVEVAGGALEHAQAIAERLAREGLPNYYGAQRFGIDGNNVQAAIRWVTGEPRARIPRFLLKLYPSVLQAEVFNRYVTRRRAQGTKNLLEGEVVRLDGTGSHFIVENPADELPRLLSGDLHLTGPMFGPRGIHARARALELETEVLRSLELRDADLDFLGRQAPGSRRDVFITVPDLVVSEPSPGALELAFTLPSGSYATEVVRQFTREPLFSPRDHGASKRGSDAAPEAETEDES